MDLTQDIDLVEDSVVGEEVGVVIEVECQMAMEEEEGATMVETEGTIKATTIVITIVEKIITPIIMATKREVNPEVVQGELDVVVLEVDSTTKEEVVEDFAAATTLEGLENPPHSNRQLRHY